MRNKILFGLAIVGILIGLVSAYIYSRQTPPQPPLATNYNPYVNGIFANGIIESYAADGENINIYPQVSGRVTGIFVQEGQTVAKRRMPLCNAMMRWQIRRPMPEPCPEKTQCVPRCHRDRE